MVGLHRLRAAVLGGLTFDIGPQRFLMPADPSENQREVEGKEGDPHLCTCDDLFKNGCCYEDNRTYIPLDEISSCD